MSSCNCLCAVLHRDERGICLGSGDFEVRMVKVNGTLVAMCPPCAAERASRWDGVVQRFGNWDAPVTDNAVPIDVPEDRSCAWCGFPFWPGDNGAIMPSGLAEHRECSLRAVLGGIGHHVDHERYCHGELGPDAGLSYRQSALLVWRLLAERQPVVEDDLAIIRGEL